MGMTPWKVERTSVLFSHPRVVLTEEAVRLPDGALVEDYLQIKIAEHVTVIVRSQNGKLLLQRQYKHGPRAVSLTFPAGGIDAGERPYVAAQRELREETGIEGRNWRALGRFVLNGNQGAGAVHLFATDYTGTDISDLRPTSNDDQEDQELLWLAEAELVEAAKCGQFKIASHALALAFALDPRLWPASA